MLGFFEKKRDFNAIVAPLTKIEEDLSSYIGEQNDRVSALEDEKKHINEEIDTANHEKAKSEHTVVKIAELLGSNFEDVVDPADEDVPETEPDEDDKGYS